MLSMFLLGCRKQTSYFRGHDKFMARVWLISNHIFTKNKVVNKYDLQRKLMPRYGLVILGIGGGIYYGGIYKQSNACRCEGEINGHVLKNQDVIENDDVLCTNQSNLLDYMKYSIETISWLYTVCSRVIFLALIYFPSIVTSPLLLVNNNRISEAWWNIFLSSILHAGPCSTKFAQWISTRPDLFPLVLCEHFKSLLSLRGEGYIPSWTLIQPIFVKRYGNSWNDVIKVSEQVLGAGCVAQVLRGTVPNNSAVEVAVLHSTEEKEIAVKVIHPHVKQSIQADIAIMRAVTNSLEWMLPPLKQVSLAESVEIFAEMLLTQVDMTREAKNFQRFSKNFSSNASNSTNLLFKENQSIHFPNIIWALTNEDILVESYEKGQILRDAIKKCTTEEKRQIANIGLDAIFKMIFIDNFIHAGISVFF